MSGSAGPETSLVVIAALAVEARAFRGLARPPRVLVAGIGAERAEAVARRAVAEGCRGLISWGTAAGLEPGLAPGTVVVGTTSCGASRRTADPALTARILESLGSEVAAVRGSIADARAPLADPGAKSEVRRRTGACAADMETAAIAAVAERAGRPWAAVRVISDGAETGLPRSVLRSLRGGRMVWWRFALSVLTAPGELGDVLRLARAFRHCRQSLARAAGVIPW